jgi:hypothetical protein
VKYRRTPREKKYQAQLSKPAKHIEARHDCGPISVCSKSHNKKMGQKRDNCLSTRPQKQDLSSQSRRHDLDMQRNIFTPSTYTANRLNSRAEGTTTLSM